MATTPNRQTPSADAPTDGTTPEVPIPSPTITRYQQLADQFMKDLDEIAASIPPLEASRISTVSFVRGHLNVSVNFLSTAIAAVEQTPTLNGVSGLDALSARDALQFIEAFRPVVDRVFAFASSLKFTVASRKASLTVDALQLYDIAKGVARDPRNAALASLVANMKRDLGRRGITKAAAARKAAAEQKALAPAKPTGAGS
jgi:hypothetical protein